MSNRTNKGMRQIRHAVQQIAWAHKAIDMFEPESPDLRRSLKVQFKGYHLLKQHRMTKTQFDETINIVDNAFLILIKHGYAPTDTTKTV